MTPENKTVDPFEELTWSDILDWAGEKATEKGIKFQEEGRVLEIKLTPEGSLIARVDGTKEYFTEVFLEENRKLYSFCTCSIGYNCKHGVAAVLEYIEKIEQGEEIPVTTEEDQLIIRVRREYTEYENSGIYEDDESSLQTLRNYLEKLEKKELIEILITFALKDSKLGSYLRERQDPSSKNIK